MMKAEAETAAVPTKKMMMMKAEAETASVPTKTTMIKSKVSVKGKYGTDNKNTGAATSVTIDAGDVKLRASMTDATFVNGPSLNGLSLTVEKPGSFMVDYDVPKKDFRFQFMNSIKVLDKPLKLTYTHMRGDNRTVLDGALVFDSANKVSANYVFGTENCKLKYTYVHEGVRTFDQCYDLSKNSWDFAVSQKLYGNDLVKASYQTSSRVLGLEWTRDSNINGVFKIAASVDLSEEVKKPKLTAETTWSFET